MVVSLTHEVIVHRLTEKITTCFRYGINYVSIVMRSSFENDRFLAFKEVIIHSEIQPLVIAHLLIKGPDM